MKKVIILGLVICTIFITGCGCSKKEIKETVCILKEEYENYTLDSTINIKYDVKNNDMVSFEEMSTLTSEKSEIRDYFISVNDVTYANYGKYYDSSIADNKAQMTIKIDFSKITTDEFVKLDDINNSYITDSKIDYTKIIEHYEKFTNYECN